MLVEWGTQGADVAQLPCFLESSPVARPLYQKKGFKTAEIVTFDLTKYGSSGTDESHVMLRPSLQ